MALIIEIVNQSKCAPVSDYSYRVRVNQFVIARGEVKGHTRDDGWDVLVQKVLSAHHAQCDQGPLPSQ